MFTLKRVRDKILMCVINNIPKIMNMFIYFNDMLITVAYLLHLRS